MFLLLYGTSGFVQTFLIAFWITNWTSYAEKTSSVKSRAILAAAFLQREVRRERHVEHDDEDQQQRVHHELHARRGGAGGGSLSATGSARWARQPWHATMPATTMSCTIGTSLPDCHQASECGGAVSTRVGPGADREGVGVVAALGLLVDVQEDLPGAGDHGSG